jgi:hypothetical protein
MKFFIDCQQETLITSRPPLLISKRQFKDAHRMVGTATPKLKKQDKLRKNTKTFTGHT